jgi:hypothetical protein
MNLRGDQLSADTSAWCLPQILRASKLLMPLADGAEVNFAAAK